MADREHVGPRECPRAVDRRAQREAAPDQPPVALRLRGHARDERLVGIETSAVALQRVGERAHAVVGDAQRLAPGVVEHALQPAGGEQFGLDAVAARPTGRAPDLAQPAPVRWPERGCVQGRGHVHRGGRPEPVHQLGVI